MTLRLRIPRSIRLRGAIYRVRTSRSLNRLETMATFDEKSRTITLAHGLSLRQREEAFLHEVLHAVFPNGVVPSKVEESVVEGLDEPLLEALRQLRWRRADGK